MSEEIAKKGTNKPRLTSKTHFPFDKHILRTILETMTKEEVVEFLLECIGKKSLNEMVISLYGTHHVRTNHQIELYFYRKMVEKGGKFTVPYKDRNELN